MKASFIILFLTALLNVASCSKIESSDIKDWLEEGTKEYQEQEKHVKSSSKVGIKKLLEKRGCISGSSARIIDTEDKDYQVYEVTCVEKSNKFIVKCDENNCQ
tara:strand:+ start:99 stop:407 length:309 start_codon:yes stop_codon:yes gene_type:complete